MSAPATVLAAGGTLQLQATVKSPAGAVLTGVQLTWTTSQASVATVDAAGRVRGAGQGAVTISAAAGSVSGSVGLEVRDTTTLVQTLSGRIVRLNLQIGPGAVHQVTGATELWADSLLQIDGTLELLPGASLVLLGGRVRMAGTIRRAPAASVALSPARAEGEGAEKWVALLSGGSVDLPATGVITGSSVFIAGVRAVGAQGAPVPVTIQGRIEARDGADGTEAARDGQPGGSVIVGGTGLTPGGAIVPPVFLIPQGLEAAPTALTIESVSGSAGPATIRAGSGGKGFTITRRSEGDLPGGNRWEGQAGNGASGGWVQYQGNTSTARGTPAPILVAGSGGEGGSIALAGGERLKDGTGPGGRGESFVGRTGMGGLPGGVSINPAGMEIQAGRAGSSGGVTLEGGNGIGGGAGGGDVTIRIARPVTMEPNQASTTLPGVILRNLGNGGQSTTAGVPGGDAGTILISDAEDLLAPPKLAYASFSNAANGGTGFNGCASAPLSAGTGGGNGGVRRTRGLPPDKLLTLNRSFSGGAGGSGLGAPGTGGEQGLDLDTDLPLGDPGPDGTDCASSLFVDTPSLGFEFSRATECVSPTTPAGQFQVTNPLPAFVGITVRVRDLTGTSGLRLLPNPVDVGSQTTMFTASLAPGVKSTFGYYLDFCSSSLEFTGQIEFFVTGFVTPFFVIPFTGSGT